MKIADCEGVIKLALTARYLEQHGIPFRSRKELKAWGENRDIRGLDLPPITREEAFIEVGRLGMLKRGGGY